MLPGCKMFFSVLFFIVQNRDRYKMRFIYSVVFSLGVIFGVREMLLLIA